MNKNVVKRLVFLISLVLMIALSKAFEKTNGLVAYLDEQNIAHYVTEYFSSGSDDNITIEIGSLIFIIPSIICLVRIKKEISIKENIVFLLFWGLQLIFVTLGLEIGKIWLTVRTGNVTLTLWLVAFLSLFVQSFTSILSSVKKKQK